jgi:hypothetical protein
MYAGEDKELSNEDQPHRLSSRVVLSIVNNYKHS